MKAHQVTVSLDIQVGCVWGKVEVDIEDFHPSYLSPTGMEPDEPAEFSSAKAYLIVEEEDKNGPRNPKVSRVQLPPEFLDILDYNELLMYADETLSQRSGED